jgi:hypothetical protein
MVSKRFITYILAFNVVMGLLLFLSSQIILIALSSNNLVIQGVGFFIAYGSTYSGPIEWTPAGVHAPLPNYPLFVFIFTLIVNIILIVKLRRNNE